MELFFAIGLVFLTVICAGAIIGAIFTFVEGYSTTVAVLFLILGVSVFGVILYLLSIIPPIEPIFTGEILKIYSNGSALLDNGTMIKLSDIPGIGRSCWCP